MAKEAPFGAVAVRELTWKEPPSLDSPSQSFPDSNTPPRGSEDTVSPPLATSSVFPDRRTESAASGSETVTCSSCAGWGLVTSFWGEPSKTAISRSSPRRVRRRPAGSIRNSSAITGGLS